MRNTTSDSGEQKVYNVIRWIPGIGQIYSTGRAITYAAKGNDQEAINSAIGSLGVTGMVINGVRLLDIFDKEDENKTQWYGNDQQYKQIPKKTTLTITSSILKSLHTCLTILFHKMSWMHLDFQKMTKP